LLQAEAHKMLREFALASSVLKEVIAMNNASDEAKIARAELAIVRDLQSTKSFLEEEGAF
jgi:hypothetical protein